MAQKIIVITRRYNDNNGLGLAIPKSDSFTYHNHTFKEDTKDNDNLQPLYEFWGNKLLSLPYINTAKLSGKNKVKQIEELFEQVFRYNHDKFMLENIDKFVNIFELRKLPTNESTHIYIYHQWLDKQGLGLLANKHFLTALKSCILKIENKLEQDCEFNWLIHDSDLLSSHYDGILQFGEKGKPKQNYLNTTTIPLGLENDNIWCFKHAIDSKYFPDFIYNAFDDRNIAKLNSAEDFYKQLAFDSDACKQRMELLGLLDIDEYKVDENTLLFILQKEPFANFKEGITIKQLKLLLEIDTNPESNNKNLDGTEPIENIDLFYYLTAGKIIDNKTKYFIKCEKINILSNLLDTKSLDNFKNYACEKKRTIIFADEIVLNRYSGSIFADALQSKFRKEHEEKNISPILVITHSEQFEKKDESNQKIHSLFDNSNIWIRTLYGNNTPEDRITVFGKAISDFVENEKLKLYEQEAAWEYIDYHLRIQKENLLNGGHRNLLPNRYASEIFDNDIKEKQNKWEKLGINNIGIRLLLVDDKIHCLNKENEGYHTDLKSCNQDGDKCNTCKLRIVKELLAKGEDFCGFNPIWDTDNVTAYKIGDEGSEDDNKKNIAKIKEYNNDTVQIIGVNSIEFAKTIMADDSLKFDLILLDYYFSDKQSADKEEHYGTELLKFIETEQDTIGKDLQARIRQNAGLENRFWIFPITAFPSSFLTHLQSDGVPLLTNKWYVYTPTNPIVMPKRFLHNLNEFIEMMVDRSVYTPERLLEFFRNTQKSLQGERGWDFDNYISVMGADYRRFLQLYGSRLNIYRDKKVSLYASSIWKLFYIASDNDIERKKLITLNHYLRKFYYSSAFLIREREGYEQLRKHWDKLKSHLDNYYLNEIDTIGINEKISKFIGKLIEPQ